jgi:hypothetical protein
MSDRVNASTTSTTRGRSGTETRSSRAVLVRLPAADHARLSVRADAAGVTLQELMRRSALAADGPPSPPEQSTSRDITLCNGDRKRLSDLLRATSSLAGLLVQAAKGERLAVGQTELWYAFERHLAALGESRQALRDILEKSR